LFVQDVKYKAPEDWEDNRPPKGKESHPVVNVSWYDAIQYCEWLSGKTGKSVTLPSEAEWEKAARSDDKREYPWGTWQEYRANTSELGLGETTPVGIFLEGASPYGLLDMSGNVWEWTRSEYKGYPYRAEDGREDLSKKVEYRSLRGGSFYNAASNARCACRYRNGPGSGYRYHGFRVVVVSPVLPSRRL
jgi:formylglycine-generating enzyme required for sulfatase activity